MSVPFLRATVVGTSRNADLALPTDEPIALVLPPLVELLREPTRAERVDIVTPTGVVLDPAATLATSPVHDGDVLRLVARTETPPTPLVHDMVELAERAGTPGRWSPVTRPWVLSLVGAVLLAATVPGLIDLTAPADRGRGWWVAAVAAAVAVAAARVLRALPAAWTLLGLGCLAGYEAVTGTAGRWDTTALAALAVVGVAVALAGWCAGRLPAAATTLGCLVVVLGAWAVGTGLGLERTRAAAVVGITALVVIGLMPRVALVASGLLRLDERVATGRVTRSNALDAVSQAHWALAGGVVVAAAGGAYALWQLARDSRLSVWPTALAAVLTLALTLRGRHFPLALERLAIWAAAAVGVLALAFAAADLAATPAVVLAVAALAGVGLLVAGRIVPATVASAQARRAATRVESLAVLASIPLAVGVFGVYGDLLATFH